MYRFAALLFFFLFASPALAASVDPSSTQAHMVRYVYEMSWEGAGGWLNKEGKLTIMLQNDIEADQQTLFLLRPDGSQAGRVLQAGASAFVFPDGKESFVVYDIMLGSAALGFPVGLRTAVDWLQGRDSQGPIDVARVERDAKGRATRLTEDGWIVEYGPWQDTHEVEYSMPRTVTLQREGTPLKVSLVLKEGGVFNTANLPPGYKPIKVM